MDLPQSAIVYEIKEPFSNLIVKNSFDNFLSIIEYIENSEDWDTYLTQDEINKVKEILCEMAKFGAINYSDEEKETLVEDIAELFDEEESSYAYNIDGKRYLVPGFDVQVLETRNFIKKAGKAISKGAKKTCHKIGHFVKKHKKEILIGAGAALTLGVITYAIVSKSNSADARHKEISNDKNCMPRDGPVQNEVIERKNDSPDVNTNIVPEDILQNINENAPKEIVLDITEPVNAALEKSDSSMSVKDFANSVASDIAHKIWELNGMLKLEGCKLREGAEKLGEFIAPGLVNDHKENFLSGDQITAEINDGHKKIDEFFATNLAGSYSMDKDIFLEKLGISWTKLEMPFPPIAEAEALEAAKIVKNVEGVIEKSETLAKNALEKKGLSEVQARDAIERTVAKEVPQKNVEELIHLGSNGVWEIEKLAEAGKVLDRAGLTKAGRALAKHGGREGSVFPKPLGNPFQINEQGQTILENILNNPNKKITCYTSKYYGKIIDIKVPKLGGVRYNIKGQFLGFLEP